LRFGLVLAYPICVIVAGVISVQFLKVAVRIPDISHEGLNSLSFIYFG
jgi:hypothetical protein